MHGRVVGTLVGGLVLVLAGCSDGGEGPTVLPTSTAAETTSEPTATTTSAASTSDPTPTTTLVLPESEAPEVDAFVRGFFDAYNAAQDSGDFGAFDALYLPQCTGCTELRAELEGWLADGGTVEGA